MEGAIKGAIVGGVTKGIGMAMSGGAAATNAAATGVENAAAGGVESAGPGFVDSVSQAGATAPTAGTNLAAGTIGKNAVADAAGGQVADQATKTGILSRVSNWIDKNPEQAKLAFSAAGGAAESLIDKSRRKDELESAMERDKLYLDSKKIKGLSGLSGETAIPSISKFTERPSWNKKGILAP
jgi:hypothetical protein